MKIEQHIIKKYKLELIEQEAVDLCGIMMLYNKIYDADIINDEFILCMIQESSKIGDITSKNLIGGFNL